MELVSKMRCVTFFLLQNVQINYKIVKLDLIVYWRYYAVFIYLIKTSGNCLKDYNIFI
jgi:hypothetical protein